MKFSISTSFYNTTDYVYRIYESLLSQTYKNWEWIVTDDFSDNSSKGVLLEISKNDKRVKYIEQSFKQELYWNPHKFSSMDTHFVISVDSDDIIYPKTLEIYKHFFLKHPDVFTIVSGGTTIKEKSGIWVNYYFGNDKWLNSSDRRTIIDGYRILITRCWRHIPYPTLDFNHNDEYKLRLNDLNSLLVLEEIGKILLLNRNLSDITIRNDGISVNEELNIFKNKVVINTHHTILENTDKRRKDKRLYSFKKLFDDEYNFLCCFFNNDNINKSSNFYILNILTEISYRQEEYLRELYFELDIKVSDFTDDDYGYYIIQNENNYNQLLDNFDNINSKHEIILLGDYVNKFNIIQNMLIKKDVNFAWKKFTEYVGFNITG